MSTMGRVVIVVVNRYRCYLLYPDSGMTWPGISTQRVMSVEDDGDSDSSVITWTEQDTRRVVPLWG